MNNKSKRAFIDMIAMRGTAMATTLIRQRGLLLFLAAQRFYEARMENAQMRLAPTNPARLQKYNLYD